MSIPHAPRTSHRIRGAVALVVTATGLAGLFLAGSAAADPPPVCVKVVVGSDHAGCLPPTPSPTPSPTPTIPAPLPAVPAP